MSTLGYIWSTFNIFDIKVTSTFWRVDRALAFIAFQSILVHIRSIFDFIESTLRKFGSTLGYLG